MQSLLWPAAAVLLQPALVLVDHGHFQFNGLGLGLSVSRKIIESHRGSIEIPHPDKSPGIIRVTLPLPEVGGN